MVFASGIFLYLFLPLFLLFYYASPRRWRSATIAVASYVFYAWWRPDFVVLMWISTGLDYHCAQAIVRDRAAGQRGRRWVVLSVAVNLGLLAYFKYFNFAVDTLNHIFLPFDGPVLELGKVILPVGISFYTFQTLSYTIDVYRGVAKPVKVFRDFMCYVAMFPQLVAGPIVRYNSIADQLHDRRHTLDKFYRGVLAFQTGLAKKILIADVLGNVADEAFANPALSTFDAWVGILAYSFQIYFDFSGYSDMAIGLGLMMGFRLPINFNQPYRSVSITDFWRRWHISLSRFLRDYLYISLGGNRKGTLRTYLNLSVTMLLGGLWHGANWTFVVWGGYQGFWLVLERLCGKQAVYGWAPKPLRIALTFVVVMIGWVFFRAADLSSALHFLSSLFDFSSGAGDTTQHVLTLRPIHLLAAVAGAAVVWLFPTTQQLVARARPAWVLSLQVAFLLAVLQLHYEDHVPFLYFQF